MKQENRVGVLDRPQQAAVQSWRAEVRVEEQMGEDFWHDVVSNLGLVYFGLPIF
jgi:hypothetical protein